ncbi:MAG: peptidoglycan glycosyltransferase [Actinobacteria bacterium HGW-Actinobacteria-7]|jgi:peptidoglycan glycosyltransferase|nr:MAG: peptidoglycan glycosyltransferase [Actinobacteria bacterium HGW-Actinobacteria-7]
MRSRRTTELLLLLAAAPPVLLVFALVETQASRAFSAGALAVPGALLAAFVIAHLAVRRFAAGADPGLIPVAFALSGLGLAFVTRLDRTLAASQVTWLFVGVAALVVTLIAVPSLERLARYKYTVMLAGIVLLVLPAFLGREINGAKLWIKFGGFTFQPGEIAKLAIILFLAAYLAENREMLSVSTRRMLGVRMPEPRTMGPLVLMWAASLFVLVFERDLGSSLLLFGIFLVMIYVATGRPSYVVTGLVLFVLGATAAWRMFDHVQSRVAIWIDPFADASGRDYQLVQSLFAFAAGGTIGVGPGQGLPTRIPFVETDFIFSAIGEELGLLGASAIILCFLVLCIRGLATAARAKTDMAAFVAVGLVASIGLQTFVIIGGVTRLIPLTGVTLPFMSYGGSSLLSTFIALGLLLRAGDEGTGLSTEMKTTSIDLGVLGRLALGRRLTRVATVLGVLLAALVVNLTWLQVIDARALNNSPANTRNLAEQARSDRGSILTRDGVVLAQSVRESRSSFRREYPKGDFAAHTVGYYSLRYGRAGVEAAANDALAGKRSYRDFSDVIDAAAGRPVAGDDVALTIDSRVQKAAEKTLSGRRGAVVVIDPRTGAVLASASNPAYLPGKVDSSWDELSSAASAPLIDRARQALYPPGSTFKVVTLTGAYSAGIATPKTTYPGPGTLQIGNAPVTNFEGGSYGRVDLETATARSINTVFAQLAVDLGSDKLVAQAKRFGFDSSLGYELPAKTSLMPDPTQMTTWETAWAGVGQPVGEHDSPAGPQATVMQMALVAAGIGNGGVVMRPYVIDRVLDPAGTASLTATTRPRQLIRATDPNTAALVAEAMRKVVSAGSGARARVSGVTVAGKTGTAEVGQGQPTNAWFIAFAPADHPTVALAILIEGGGVGGQVAAPAAQPVLEAALKAQGSK